MKSIFLGWDKPYLWQVAIFLKEKYPDFNLNNIKILCPSKRAARRLIELLANLAEEENTALINPTIISQIIDLAECQDFTNISENNKKFANTHITRILWSEIIDSYNRTTEEKLDARISEYLNKLSRQLVENKVDATLLNGKLVSEKQNAFWELFNKLNERFHSNLNSQNLTISLEDFKLSPTTNEVYLLGAFDLSKEEEEFLENVDRNITTLIFAPEDCKNGFTKLGTISESYWQNKFPAIDNQNVIITNSPLEEIESIIEIIENNFNTTEVNNSVTICPRDPSVIAPIINLLKQKNYNSFAPGIRPLGRTIWGGLYLNILSSWDGNIQSFINVLSSPIIKTLLDDKKEISEEDLLSKLLIELRELLKYGRSRNQTFESIINKKEYSEVLKILSSFNLFLNEKNLNISNYLERIISSLTAISSELLLSENSKFLVLNQEDYNLSLESLESLKTNIEQLNLKESYLNDPLSLLISIAREISLKISIQPESDSGIQILGAYEVFWDDNSYVFSTSSTDEYLPPRIEIDPYLPESIKEEFGIRGRKWLQAYHSYTLHTLVNSKKRVLFSASKTNNLSEPNKLSRYLSIKESKPDDSNLSNFYGNTEDKSKNEISKVQVLTSPKLELPNGILKPPTQKYEKFPLKSISPSQIRDYLYCPYEFYLKHILGLKTEDEDNSEIPENIFGNITHKVIAIVSSEFKNTAYIDYKNALSLCYDILEKEIQTVLGKTKSIEIHLQIQSIKNRLQQYLDFEIECKTNKHILKYIEHRIENTKLINISSGEQIPLVGVIDRVELVAEDLLITDFKTGDDSKTSISRAQKDYQLPIYGLALSQSEEFKAKNIKLQIVSLNKTSTHDKKTIDFQEEQIIEVKEIINSVSENILNANFWPPTSTAKNNEDSRILKRLFGNLELCR